MSACKIKRAVALLLCIMLVIPTLVSLTSCSEKSETFMTVGGYNVSYDMVRYFVMNYKAGYTEEELKDPEILKQIETNALASIKELYTYKALCEKYNVKLSSDDKSAIKTQIKTLKKSYESTEAFEKDLEANFVTEAVYKEIIEIETLCDKLYDRITENATDDRFKSDTETIDADLRTDKWFATEYMYLVFTSETKEDREEFMKSARADIAGGVIMSKLCENNKSAYGDNLVYAIDECFTESIYNETIENAVKELKVGETSEVIEYSSGAWLIVRRIPISDEYVEENYDTIIAQYLSREFFNYVTEESDKLTVKIAEKFENTPLSSIN